MDEDLNRAWAEKRYDVVIKIAERLLESDPTDLGTYARCIYSYNQLGDSDSSMRTARKAMENTVDSPPIINSLGDLIWDSGYLSEALIVYEKAYALVQLKPDTYHQAGEILYNIGCVQFQKGEFEQSVDTFRQVLQMPPEKSQASENLPLMLGQALIKIGKLEEALPHLNSYVEKNSEDIKGCLLLGDTYYALEHIEQAQQCWQHVLRLDNSAYVAKAKRRYWTYRGKSQRRWWHKKEDLFDY